MVIGREEEGLESALRKEVQDVGVVEWKLC